METCLKDPEINLHVLDRFSISRKLQFVYPPIHLSEQIEWETFIQMYHIRLRLNNRYCNVFSILRVRLQMAALPPFFLLSNLNFEVSSFCSFRIYTISIQITSHQNF